MRNLAFVVIFLLISQLAFTQENQTVTSEKAVYVLGVPAGSDYKYIHFPKKNIILKRGAIANFNSIIGTKVVVDRTPGKSKMADKVVLKRKDGRNFFRFFPTVKADLEKALEAGELKKYKDRPMGP